MAEEQIETLRRYLQRVMADERSAVGVASVGSPPVPSLEDRVGAAAANDQERDRALAATETLLDGGYVDHSERLFAEAIVLPLYRPVVDVVDDSFAPPPAPWDHLGREPVRARLRAAILSVGRIEVPDHPAIPYAGTGFVVGDGLLMTNRHVAALFASGLGRRDLAFLPARTPAVDFKREVVETEPLPLAVTAVRLIHPHWDCALLEVDGLPPERAPLLLDGRGPDTVAEREVAVLGYPAQDWRNDQALQDRIFNGVYERKRLQPGRLMGYRVTKSYGHQVEALAHDSSTLGGNSGSAVIDLATGRTTGLHFAGRYLEANFAVPAWALARDPYVVDAGVHFALDQDGGAGEPLGGPPPAWLEAWREVDSPPPDAAG